MKKIQISIGITCLALNAGETAYLAAAGFPLYSLLNLLWVGYWAWWLGWGPGAGGARRDESTRRPPD